MIPVTALTYFGLITCATIAIEIFYTDGTRGIAFGFSSQCPVVAKDGLALRVERVYRNQVESAAYVVPALGAAALAGMTASTICWVIILGRAGFSLAYYTGIPFLRVPFFTMGSFGSLILIYQVLTQGAV